MGATPVATTAAQGQEPPAPSSFDRALDQAQGGALASQDAAAQGNTTDAGQTGPADGAAPRSTNAESPAQDASAEQTVAQAGDPRAAPETLGGVATGLDGWAAEPAPSAAAGSQDVSALLSGWLALGRRGDLPAPQAHATESLQASASPAAEDKPGSAAALWQARTAQNLTRAAAAEGRVAAAVAAANAADAAHAVDAVDVTARMAAPGAALAPLAAEATPLAAATGLALPTASAASPASATSAASASVHEGRLAASPGSPDFAPQLGAQISLMVRDGLQHARLHLNPAEMGPLTVQIALDGSAAQVRMAAEHPLTRQALEQAMPGLAGALRDMGLTLTGGGVFDRSSDPGEQGKGQGQGPSASARRGAQADPALGAAHSALGGERRRGVVDLVA